MRAMKKRNRPLAPLLAMRTHHRELDERYNRTRCDTDLKYALTRFELKVEPALFGLRTIMDESVQFCANHRRTAETVILPAVECHLSEFDQAPIDAALESRPDASAMQHRRRAPGSLYRLITKAVRAVGRIY